MMHHLVVCFRCPRSPYDLVRTATDQLCQTRARLFQGHVGAIAYPMRTRGVANELLGSLEPRFSCCGVRRRGGIVVEISHTNLSTETYKMAPGRRVFSQLYAVPSSERGCVVLDQPQRVDRT